MKQVREDENWPYDDILYWVDVECAMLGLHFESQDGERIRVKGPFNQMWRKADALVKAYYEMWGGPTRIDFRHNVIELLPFYGQKAAAQVFRDRT
jgi:hypothetical protein